MPALCAYRSITDARLGSGDRPERYLYDQSAFRPRAMRMANFE